MKLNFRFVDWSEEILTQQMECSGVRNVPVRKTSDYRDYPHGPLAKQARLDSIHQRTAMAWPASARRMTLPMSLRGNAAA
jgi:hypothetical protein